MNNNFYVHLKLAQLGISAGIQNKLNLWSVPYLYHTETAEIKQLEAERHDNAACWQEGRGAEIRNLHVWKTQHKQLPGSSVLYVLTAFNNIWAMTFNGVITSLGGENECLWLAEAGGNYNKYHISMQWIWNELIVRQLSFAWFGLIVSAGEMIERVQLPYVSSRHTHTHTHTHTHRAVCPWEVNVPVLLWGSVARCFASFVPFIWSIHQTKTQISQITTLNNSFTYMRHIGVVCALVAFTKFTPNVRSTFFRIR